MRVEQIGNATLYLGDCMEILPTLGKVDAVITDPPYGIQTHEGARTGKGDEILIDFASITADELVTIAAQCVEKASRWVVMTCEWKHAAMLESLGSLVRLGVWIKPNGAPQFTGDRPGMGWEAVAILHRPGKKRWNGGGHHAVWQFNKQSGEHPTQKPLGLLEKWVSQFTDQGETVCDPFMGSGTTGVACLQLGRRFIGIERDPAYFDVACKRIRQAHAQGQLFEPTQAAPVQLDLAVPSTEKEAA